LFSGKGVRFYEIPGRNPNIFQLSNERDGRRAGMPDTAQKGDYMKISV
jgi:hypothetical protein